MDIAVVGMGVNLTLDGGVVKAARTGLGAVAPAVLLVEDAAKALIGSRLEDAAVEAAAAACPRRLQPDQRQARHHRIPHQGGRGAAGSAPPPSRRSAPEGTETMSKTHRVTSGAGRDHGRSDDQNKNDCSIY